MTGNPWWSTPGTVSRPWWTPKQIAETLQITPRTVQPWIMSGTMPVHRFGRAVRISNDDFETFIARPCPPNIKPKSQTLYMV
jgi:excisionase family DNA binding protein